MPTHTQKDSVLTLTLPAGLCGNPHDIACQVTGASYKVSTPAKVEGTPVACGGDPVIEASAERTPGEIKFDIFKDTTDAGLTTLMMLAAQSGVAVPFTYTENPSEPTIKWSAEGKATFGAEAVDFTPGQIGKHPVTMSVPTETLTFPGQLHLPAGAAKSSLAALRADPVNGDGHYTVTFTTGQYVVLDDGTCASYNGTVWAAGAAT